MRYDFTHVYLISWWYDLQFLRIRVWQTKFGNYGAIFALLTPHPPPPTTLLKTPKIRILIKWKSCWKKLHMCTKNHNHMRYGFWDRVRQIWSFWAIFCPFTPLTTQKIKILKKWKTHMKISSFYICVPKITITWYMLSKIWVQHTIFCHFRSFFTLPHYWLQKLKIEKNKEIFPFSHVYNK